MKADEVFMMALDSKSTREQLLGVDWLDKKIGGWDEPIQVAWLKSQNSNIGDFENAYGASIYQYADMYQLDYGSLLGWIEYYMVLLLKINGYVL